MGIFERNWSENVRKWKKSENCEKGCVWMVYLGKLFKFSDAKLGHFCSKLDVESDASIRFT